MPSPAADLELPSPKLSQRWHWASKGAISYLMQQAVENPQCISLAAGLVDPHSLPIEETRAAVQQMLANETDGRTVLQYGTTAGSERLRRHLISHLARLEGVEVEELNIDAEQVILTTGSQQLLSLVGEVLLDPGDICLVAAPTYFVFLGVLEGLGARVIPVDTDADGMRMDALEEQLRRIEADGDLHRVKMIYLVSYYENPSGVALATERRSEAVEIARRWSKEHRLFVLEDAAYRELRYDGPVLPSVWSHDADRRSVVLAQTFSKSFSPGLRIGFGVVPKELVRPICDRKGNEDFGSANFNQHLLATVFERNAYYSHVEKVRESYRVKRDAMLAAAHCFFSDIPGVEWVHPHGGLYVWMTLPQAVSTGFESRLFEQAVHAEQVMYVPGELCYAPPENGIARPANQMRLSYGVQTPEGITEGMRRLANAVRAVV